MRVQVLSRNPDQVFRETSLDIQRLPRNYSPHLHPFHEEREYVRAVNSTKLERVFAKPFLGTLDGHTDGIYCMATHPHSLSTMISGSGSGEVFVWNLSKRLAAVKIQAHRGMVNDLVCSPSGDRCISVGSDALIKHWSLCDATASSPSPLDMCGSALDDITPLTSLQVKLAVTSVDHHRESGSQMYATCAQNTIDLWDYERADPKQTYQWGIGALSKLRFSPVETSLLCGLDLDRHIVLYDVRRSDPIRRITLDFRSNAVSWNPMEAYTFVVANDDYNLYSFDLRRLDSALYVHTDHISAVVDVDFCPTGKEFVSASSDKTLRIYSVNKGRSRDVYHTKRMQRIFSVKWTLDNRYILSGSEELNIRLWKAKAWDKLGVVGSREKSALDYSEKLKRKYQNHPEIRRISRHRHLTRYIHHGMRESQIMKKAQRRKQENRRRHSKPGQVPYVHEKRKHIIGVDE